MRHVAFLRNLNQGQRNNPTSEQLVDAFERAGASGISLIRGNGTVVFDADDPTGCADVAVRLLAEGSGWSDVAFVRSLAWIADILTFVHTRTEDQQNLELTVFDESLTPAKPLTGRRSVVIESGQGFALTMNERANESDGTSTLERALGVKATSRGIPTLQLLARRS